MVRSRGVASDSELRNSLPLWVAQAEGNDARLDQGGELVGHPRWPALAGSEHLQAEAKDRTALAVIGRGVDTHRPAGSPDLSHLRGQTEEPRSSEPIQDVIIAQAASLLLIDWNTTSME
jgi:hypothetical protein